MTMLAPLPVPNAADPGFVAVNQADLLGSFRVPPDAQGFDVTRAEWAVGATDEQRRAMLANFGLKLTYTFCLGGLTG